MKKKIRVSRAEIGHAATKIAYFRPGLKSGSWIPEERAGSRHGKVCRFHASKRFFTDDEGVYLLDNRDSPARWTGHKLLRRGADAAGDGTRHFAEMHDAVEALCERKFGPGGPFHPNTPGSWKDSGKVRSAAPVQNQEFRECVALPGVYSRSAR